MIQQPHAVQPNPDGGMSIAGDRGGAGDIEIRQGVRRRAAKADGDKDPRTAELFFAVGRVDQPIFVVICRRRRHAAPAGVATSRPPAGVWPINQWLEKASLKDYRYML